MALSTSAQPEMSLTALNRGVRQASQEAHGKGSLKRGSKARKGGKNRKTAKRRELKGEKGEKRKGGNGKKIRGKNVRKGNKKKKASGKRRKGNKFEGKEGKRKKASNRQKTKTGNDQRQENRNDFATDNCKDYYLKLRDLRYDQNQLSKVKRIDSLLNKLQNKFNKSLTAFKNGSEFFESCPNPEGQDIYDILRSEIILLSCQSV